MLVRALWKFKNIIDNEIIFRVWDKHFVLILTCPSLMLDLSYKLHAFLCIRICIHEESNNKIGHFQLRYDSDGADHSKKANGIYRKRIANYLVSTCAESTCIWNQWPTSNRASSFSVLCYQEARGTRRASPFSVVLHQPRSWESIWHGIRIIFPVKAA